MRLGILIAACVLAVQIAAWSQAPAPPPAGDTVTLSRAEFEAWKARMDKLEKKVEQLNAQKGVPAPAAAPAEPAPPTEITPPSTGEAPSGPPTEITPGVQTAASPAAAPGGKFYLLPDISAVVQSKLNLSTDQRDENRYTLKESEAEVAIQGYVYPNVKADVFISMSPAENSAANVEEAYLTYISLRPGLTAQLGRKHVPFGRTNLLHNHSWLYVNQPKALQNLVANESLEGQGANFSYVLRAPSDYSAQLDLGAWTGDGPEGGAEPAPGQPLDPTKIMVGPGAGYPDKFYTARLWTAHAIGGNSELELGGSYAQGAAPTLALPLAGANGTTRLGGLDATYRHYGAGNERLLLRAEAVRRCETSDNGDSTADGYYLFGNIRHNAFSNWGALYDWSEFPQAPNLHESAESLIYTMQFSEQYFLRFEGTHGSRPGDGSYNELWAQWCWGVGPHTHNLE